MVNSRLDSLDFDLPAHLEAGEPPEARGLGRDEVRLMVSRKSDDSIEHVGFRDLPNVLRPGDVLAINTSGTRKASLPAVRTDGSEVRLHLSTRLPADLWMVEMRSSDGTRPFLHARPVEVMELPGGGSAHLHAPYRPELRNDPLADVRLWIATLALPCDVDTYMDVYGAPIRYGYVHEDWPIEVYQNVYATEAGSAEMPSAGRAFTPEVITKLVATGRSDRAADPAHRRGKSGSRRTAFRGVLPRAGRIGAGMINLARENGGRIIAVGTTVVRALETVAEEAGRVHPGQGWTDLVISPERPMRIVDGLLTGMHEPRATHLAMLQALTGPDHLRADL